MAESLAAMAATGGVVAPAGAVVRGTVRVPPSKSYSNRYLLLALLAQSPVTIRNLLEAEDTRHFLAALESIGHSVHKSGAQVRVGPRGVARPARDIHCGGGGTMYRFLTAALTVVPGRWTLDGSSRLRERPVGALVRCLRALGAQIDYVDRDGYAPLVIEGGSLVGGSADLDAGESSQYLSAVLMAAVGARKPVEIHVTALSSSPYLAITRDALRRFGVVVDEPGPDRFRVQPVRLTVPPVLEVEGDYSAAAYPAAAAVLTGGQVDLLGLREDSLQGDRRFFELLAQTGAQVAWSGGQVRVSGVARQALRADMADIPDQVPTLAALAPFLAGTTEIVNVAHLRIKESDRIAATQAELSRLGVVVRELDDGLVVEGCWHRRTPPGDPVVVATYNDHRIAMSMALVGLRRPGVTISEPMVVAKSYPNFWRDLDTLVG